MRAIELVFFDAGGGHRSAANALKHVIEQQQKPWEVRLTNLQDLLDPLDFFRKITGIRGQDIYNLLLRKGWTLGSPQMVPVMHALIRMYHKQQVDILRAHWKESGPDLAVSLIPNFNRAMFQSLGEARPGTPMVTVLTDLADYPPHFWIERQDQYFICGTERAAQQAREIGNAEDHVFRTSGMILNPRFYEPVAGDRRAMRAELGLDPDAPTALVLFGGWGSSAMSKIAGLLNRPGLNLQLIMVCGHNQRLAARLRSMKSNLRMRVEGFTREIPRLMHISDFFIGKPGPGSISEALHMKLPVIVEKNAWTLPQERYNADWVRENDLGIVLDSFSGIAAAVERMLERESYCALRKRVEGLNNRAVFEIPGMFERIMLAYAQPDRPF